MLESTLSRLMVVREYPAVSVYAGRQHAPSGGAGGPVRMKALLREVDDRLAREFTPEQVQPIRTALEALAAEVDYADASRGVALFASRSFATLVNLPLPVEDAVVVDDTFLTRYLVHAMHRSRRYRVLVISGRRARLFEGMRGRLEEVAVPGLFPCVPDADEGDEAQDAEDRPRGRDERHRRLLREADRRLAEVHGADPLPLVVTGVDRSLAAFRELTGHARDLLLTVRGSYDRAAPHEIAARVWPRVEEALQAESERLLGALDRAVGLERCASGIDAVWQASQEGRGELLLVEEGFRCSALRTPEGLVPAEIAPGPDLLDDAVDEIVERVIGARGRVAFVDDGALAAHGRIALVLRY